ncbi:expressed unknown protein [Seminavis robusta]|uniref:PUB domain-containing protein n=1 Tax=Seminavis robusta TaxID=568900 RepID=A0A9N8EPD0_9STRA|nr:expressed unknown protein [Seminavis robusta]|eukprot:Sro1591_g284460.1 n/a (368) ;mRNA; r:6826-7929
MATSDAHLEWITSAALVELLEASHGVFGELIEPSLVLQGLALSDNVGRLDDPQSALATQAMHSFSISSSGDNPEIKVEFDNTTPHALSLRWMDEEGRAFVNGTVEPFSSMVRYSRCGHLFLVSAVIAPQNEQLLGGYRVRMPCPSGSSHQLLIEEENASGSTSPMFRLESLIADPTGHDELVIAAAALDSVGAGPQHAACSKTVKTLHTIFRNLLAHPDDPKYQSLRISNPKVQTTLLQNGAARQMLYCTGFRENVNDDHWIWKSNANLHAIPARLEQASKLLQFLLERSQPGFVAELALTPVWQGPILNSSLTNANTRGFGAAGSTHFLSDDEKWDRAERNRQRRGRGGRKPTPGSAPSSNGRWGR